MIIGIDTGSAETAACLIGPNYQIVCAQKLPNGELTMWLRSGGLLYMHMAIEGLRGMGARVGAETFLTAYMVGRCTEIGERQGAKVVLYHRPDYLHPLCGGRPAKNKSDATLYKALLQRFGKDHLKPLVGASDLRSAFAVAVYHMDVLKTTHP